MRWYVFLGVDFTIRWVVWESNDPCFDLWPQWWPLLVRQGPIMGYRSHRAAQPTLTTLPEKDSCLSDKWSVQSHPLSLYLHPEDIPYNLSEHANKQGQTMIGLLEFFLFRSRVFLWFKTNFIEQNMYMFRDTCSVPGLFWTEQFYPRGIMCLSNWLNKACNFLSFAETVIQRLVLFECKLTPPYSLLSSIKKGIIGLSHSSSLSPSLDNGLKYYPGHSEPRRSDIVFRGLCSETQSTFYPDQTWET